MARQTRKIPNAPTIYAARHLNIAVTRENIVLPFVIQNSVAVIHLKVNQAIYLLFAHNDFLVFSFVLVNASIGFPSIGTNMFR